MNLFPLRTAVIAGTCAIALSFTALPAFAATTPDGSACTVLDSSDPAYDPTCVEASDGAAATDYPQEDDGADQNAGDTIDDSGAMNNGAPAGDDTSGVAVALPAEQGKPKQHFAATVLAPAVIAKKGITVRYTGLTPRKSYQPFYSTGQSGGELGKVRTASSKGVIAFTYTFDKSEKKQFATLGAVYTIGLLGQDTDLRLTQEIAVKYDSDLTWHAADRHAGKVTLSVSVDRAGASGRDSAWSKARVAFQKKVGTTWKTVATVRTDAKGDAEATVRSSSATWRAVVRAGTTVSGSTSRGHTA